MFQQQSSMDATMRSLLRDRLQTSIDGVTRTPECSRTVARQQAILRSRAGVLALLCWLAAYSCSSPAPPQVSKPSSRSSSLRPPDTSRRLLDLASSPSRPTASYMSSQNVPHRAAVLRSVHANARSRPTHQLPLNSLKQSSTDAPPAAGRALSSLTHPHPQPRHRPNTWLDRLANTLSSLLGASAQQTEHKDTRGDGVAHTRHRHRGVGRIHGIMQDPNIYDPIVLPRHPIVLCHGLYGFDVRGPFLGLEIHYWAKTLDILRKKMGVEVLVHGVPPTGSIQERAESLHKFLVSDEAGVRGKKLNFVAHSMGGLDVRHLLTHIRPKPEEYTPVSLTTISTPHRGSPFMDWCNANIGIGNDYIEKAIEEARAERAHLADRDYRPTRTTKVPYTLKSPLFTRPKPLQGSNSLPKKEPRAAAPDEPKQAPTGESTAETLFAAASSAVGALTSKSDSRASGEISDKVKEAVKKGKGGDGSLPFGLSSFINSLSTLTGSFSSYMLSLLDTPAYAMLSTKYMNEVFNPRTPNMEGVKYYSVASRTPSLAIWHPLWLPKLILDAAAESRTTGGEIDGSADALGGADQGNDGLVSVESAKWGEFLGVMEGCDHWDLRGGGAPRWKQNINPSTGKPYPTKAAQQEADKKAREEEEKSSSSWIDINRLLFSQSKDKTSKDVAVSKDATKVQPMTAFRSFKELAESEGWNGVSLRDPDAAEDVDAVANNDEEQEQDGEHATFSFLQPQHQDDTLVREIASWISDRLPSGNAERRAIAQKRDKMIEETGLTLYAPQNPVKTSTDLPGFTGVTDSKNAFSAVASVTESAPKQEVRPFSTQLIAQRAAEAEVEVRTEKRQEVEKKDGKEKVKPKEYSDLERFWIALCRHLHNEGH